MKIIAEKKINSVVAGVALYLSFCAANFYFARGDWAYFLSRMSPLYQTAFLSNPFFAFIAGGVLPYAFYEIFTLFFFRSMRPRIGFVVEDLKYELRFFYFAANICVALCSLLYLISPIISIYGGVVFPFLFTTVFAALYIAYIFRRHIEKGRWGSVLVRLGGAYIGVYALLALLSILGVA